VAEPLKLLPHLSYVSPTPSSYYQARPSGGSVNHARRCHRPSLHISCPLARLCCDVVLQSASIDLGFSVSTVVHRSMQMTSKYIAQLTPLRGSSPTAAFKPEYDSCAMKHSTATKAQKAVGTRYDLTMSGKTDELSHLQKEISDLTTIMSLIKKTAINFQEQDDLHTEKTDQMFDMMFDHLESRVRYHSDILLNVMGKAKDTFALPIGLKSRDMQDSVTRLHLGTGKITVAFVLGSNLME
jgi:hypothetical protein